MISECLVVEFRVTGDGCPLAEATRTAGATVDAAPPLRRADGYTLLRFSSPDPELGAALERDDRIRYLHRAGTDDGHTYRCLSKERCVLHRLIDEGFLVESVAYRDGVERHVGAVVGQAVLEGVLSAAGETVGVRLERVSPLREEGDRGVDGRWDLTPAQSEALAAAYEMGYFDVPKGVTAAEVAADLDVSKSAFLERLRRGQRALLGQVLG